MCYHGPSPTINKGSHITNPYSIAKEKNDIYNYGIEEENERMRGR